MRPTAVRIGLAAAILSAALYLVAVLFNPVTSLLPAIAFVCAAVGIWKGKAWSAYGCALFLLALAAGAMAGELRTSGHVAPGLLWSAGFAVASAWLLIAAGRALGHGGRAAAWIAVSAATLLFLCTYKAYVVPSGAMEETLRVGDYLYVRLAGPSYLPERGDVVALRYPPDPKQVFIKRVVAVGGDRVRLRDKVLVVNGAAQNEPYAIHKTQYVDAFRDNFPDAREVRLTGSWSQELASYVEGGELVVPAGKYFVLGDNRDDSLDSRYWGFLERADVIGRPAFVYFSAERQNSAAPILFTPRSIRWSRIFHAVR